MQITTIQMEDQDGTPCPIEWTYIPEAQADCWRYDTETAWRVGVPPHTLEEVEA